MNARTDCLALPRRSPAARVVTTLAVAALAMGALAASASAAVRSANASTLESALAGAQGGDVIVLAAGDYGTFEGAAKAAPVTIQSQPGEQASMDIDWSSAANIRLENVTIRSATVRGSTHDVTIARSRFTGMAVVRAETMVNANIVFDGNTHAGINVCGDCYEGRLSVAGEGPGPSGVTIRNSVFGPGGNSDGVQISANGVQVLGNQFLGIRQVSDVHSDALQLYGQSNTTVRGNYFHDNDVAIMAPDGGRNEQITDNVFVSGGEYRPAVQLGSQDNTLFAHNTIRGIDVMLDAKPGDSPSRGSVARDNVLVDGSLNVPGSECTGCTVTHNLFTRRGSGASAIVAMPQFAGGSSPSSYVGHVLAAGSPGKNTATDGTDRGIRVAPAPSRPPAQPGNPPGTRRRTKLIRAKLLTPRWIRWSQLRRGIRVRVWAKEPVRVVVRLTRKGTRRLLARKARRITAGRHTFRLRSRSARRHTHKLALMVRATNRAGQATVVRRTIRIKRRR